MQIDTSRFGLIEIDEEKVLTLTQGILGFPEQRRYVLLPHGGKSPFYWFQSVDRPDLAFVVTNPSIFTSDYAFDVPDFIGKELKIEKQEEVQVLVLLTIPKNKPQGITANLLGPMIINTKKMLGRQTVLDPKIFPVRFPLLPQSNDPSSQDFDAGTKRKPELIITELRE